MDKDRRATRRELMTGAIAAGAAGVLAGGRAPGMAVADGPPPSPAELLGTALDVERLMVLAYRRVFASGALSPGIQQAITPHLAHEIAHVSAVAAELTRLGEPAPTGPLSLKAASDIMGDHNVSGSLTDLHTENDCLKLLVDLESVAEGAHYTPLKDLTDPRLVRLSAQILACEAQHWTVLSGLRNPGQYVKAIPWPYVYGSK
jgi:Ferritin-like domain